jgi:DNA-binding SARP family transcriptional activator/tetratricopeptide (TPR) repeat protein
VGPVGGVRARCVSQPRLPARTFLAFANSSSCQIHEKAFALRLRAGGAVDAAFIGQHNLKSPHNAMPVEPRRYLRCLGHPVLFAPNGDPVRFRTRKHLALLIYLAVDARPHQRVRLAELLWPKVSLTEARHSLATALSTLRPRLGPKALDTGRDHVQLVPGHVDLDLNRLQAGDILGTEVTGVLPVAAFLDGFEIADAVEFTHWKDRQQARLLPMIKDALVVLIDRCRRTGDSREIERLADRMLALDELSEEAIRAKMEARAFAGDRLTALEFYEEWRVKLAEELQAVPSDLVEGIAVRLRRRGWERTTLTNIPTVPTDQWRGRPFIGRAAEYRILYEAWEAVRRGEPGHALILGDSGVGKTTLVEKLTTAAGLEGAAISRVQCYDVEREIPYSTVSNLVLGLLDRPGVSATSPQVLAELSRTVPAVRQRFPAIPEATDSQGESARIRLTEAFHDLLATIAEEHPVIVVVDDVHFADDVSLAVLHLIMRRATNQSIMMLLLARPGELSQSPHAASLRTVAPSLGIREIEVQPLAEDESIELLTSLLPSDEPQPTTAVLRALLRCGAGYPMVLELLVQDWKNNGEQSLALAVGAMIEDFGIGRPAEAPYSKILQSITRSLDATTHSVMNLAAMLGHRLNDFNTYGVIDLTAGQTMAGMAELVRRRVLRDGSHGLEFVNEMVRTAAYMGVPVSLRRVLHGKIADRFVEEHSRGDGTLGLEIAWHCIRAGRGQQATPYLLDGARRALARGALHEAEYGLTTALPHLTGSARAEGLLLLVEILQDQGRWDESIGPLQDPILEGMTDLASVFLLTANHRTANWPVDKLSSDIAHLHQIVQSTPEVATRVRAVHAAAHLLAHLRDEHLSMQLLTSAESIPTDNLREEHVDELELSKAHLQYQSYEHTASLRRIIQLVRRFESRGTTTSMLSDLYCGLGAIYCSLGRYADAYHEFSKGYEVSSRLANETSRGILSAQLALCCGRLGDYRGQLAWSNTALRTLGSSFLGYCAVQATYHASYAYAMMGELQRGAETISIMRERLPHSSPPWLKQASFLFEADILHLTGDTTRAITRAREALDYNSLTSHSASFTGPFTRWLAKVSESLDEKRSAAVWLESTLSKLDRHDALDQVEILCACIHMGMPTAFGAASIRKTLEEKLAQFPYSTTDQLKRLGFLRF